jgi:hypothetical protein
MTLSRLCVCLAALLPAFATAQASGASKAQPSRCATFASAPWLGGPTPRLKIEAFSEGPTCAKAVTVFVVRDASGDVLYSESHQSQFVMPLSDARTRAQMQTALRSWVTSINGASIRAGLPDWRSGAEAPVDQEFGFLPAEGMSRTDYLAIKTGRMPLLCYVQGMESLKCLVYRNGGFEDFGIQLFPG